MMSNDTDTLLHSSPSLFQSDVHDVLNVFQCTGLNDEDKYFMKTCPAKKDDYLEASVGRF